MLSTPRGTSRALAVATHIILLVVVSGCLGVADHQASLPAEYPPPCNSGEFLLSDDIIAASDKVGPEEAQQYNADRFAEQSSLLSLRLVLLQDAVDYGDPVPFRIIIANQADHPVIFFRPQSISFEQYAYPAQLVISLSSRSQDWLHSVFRGFWDEFGPGATKEWFSMLQPGESCSVDLVLAERATSPPLLAPLPPGEYEMSVVLRGFNIGPWTEGEYGYYDVGAWVGRTKPSNAVTFTILPLD